MGYHEERSLLDILLPIYRSIRLNLFNQLETVQNTSVQGRSLVSYSARKQVIPENIDFPCALNFTRRSTEVPTSVNRLRPGDIDVVGAIGDSITAGYGIFDTAGLTNTAYEARGSSFTIGGQETWETYLTLPNILKLYNPKLYGYSLHSVSFKKKSMFNVAEGGAVSQNLPYMSKVLVNRIKSNPNVDVDNHWKMITIFIGHNDFCTNICYTTDYEQFLRDHETDMLEVLRILKKNLPRTIVNLLPLFDLKKLVSQNEGLFCQYIRIFYCPCLLATQYKHLRIKYFDILRRWQELDLKIADYPEFHTSDFTVIGHPFTINYSIPLKSNGKTNYNYIGPDCFHPSQRGHAKVANDLWNSLFMPYGKKILSTSKEFETFICPTEEHPYIYTKENSLE
ncbi:hypothetical protein GWI33_004299 [Rhynchophorus ferrugineus]|uniref:Phospholipase B1, membrane-associated n=1 Tax=Rhynchophorus ferrugineus TaxID=354439 RepID=A0A834IQ93_RHYFE|nr:hypothetical protein GWI33_004299 [Rhynchophorus ferrugineus]